MSGDATDEKKPQKKSDGWIGCVAVLLLCGVLPALGLGWSFWDDGTFDTDLSNDVKAVALGPSETSWLAERLQEASSRQGVCYGWEVEADTAAPVEIGSNLGVGVDVRQDSRCPDWVVLKAGYFYDSTYKEWYSVTFSIEANSSRGQPTVSDLSGLGVVSSGKVGERAIAELADAIGSLPLLAAGANALPPVDPQEQTFSPSATVDDELASAHGAGWWSLNGLGCLLIGLGLFWIVRSAVKERKWRKGS